MREKLVRDKIRDRYPDAKMRVAKGEDYLRMLKYKLVEEAQEIVNAKTREEKREECADLLEVLYTYMEKEGFSLQGICEEMVRKTEENGGFKNGDVWIKE